LNRSEGLPTIRDGVSQALDTGSNLGNAGNHPGFLFAQWPEAIRE